MAPKLAVTAMTLGLLVGACGTPSGEENDAQSRQASPPASKVLCGADDLVMEVTRDLATGEGEPSSQGGISAQSPEAALNIFFNEHDASEVPVSEFEPEESVQDGTEDSVKLVHEDKDKGTTDAVVVIEQIGDDWNVTKAEICNDFIRKLQQ